MVDLPAVGVDVALNGSSAVVSSIPEKLSWLRVRAVSCAGASEWSEIALIYPTKASDWEDEPVPAVEEGDEAESCPEDLGTPVPSEPDGDNSPATGAPTISGTAKVGETLTADTSGIADEDGLSNAAFNYQWLAGDTAIQGAIGSSYTLVEAEEGKAIRVRVSFTDDGGNDETLTSTATATVSFAVQAQIANSPATGAPTISGTVQVGETLTADTSGIADEDGLDNASFAYQWIANEAEIAGATGSSYTLEDADEGKAIKVEVSFIDDEGNEETLTSAATGAVSAATQPNTPATGAPTISGTARVGETLTADTSGIADEDGLSNTAFTYQWLAGDSDISGATGSTPWQTPTRARQSKYGCPSPTTRAMMRR